MHHERLARFRLVSAAVGAAAVMAAHTVHAADPPRVSPLGLDDSGSSSSRSGGGSELALVGGGIFSVTAGVGGFLVAVGGSGCIGMAHACPGFRRSAFVFGGLNAGAAVILIPVGAASEDVTLGGIGAAHAALAAIDFVVGAHIRETPLEEKEAAAWSIRPSAGPTPLGFGLAGTF